MIRPHVRGITPSIQATWRRCQDKIRLKIKPLSDAHRIVECACSVRMQDESRAYGMHSKGIELNGGSWKPASDRLVGTSRARLGVKHSGLRTGAVMDGEPGPRKTSEVSSRGVSVTEVRTLRAVLDGRPRLIASLLCGTGMWLMECVRPRVKDVNSMRNEIWVRHGKGGKDRRTVLPRMLIGLLQREIDRIRLHAQPARSLSHRV